MGWIEGVILIPKRMILWRGVRVFSQFWGREKKIMNQLSSSPEIAIDGVPIFMGDSLLIDKKTRGNNRKIKNPGV